MIKCKLTGKVGKGVRSHIIPKSFYNIDPEERLPTRLLSNTEGSHPQRIPIGVYDSEILIEEGERVFSQWDDYATEILINRKSDFQQLHIDNKLALYQLPEYNYDLLKLFFLSVLWRASASSHKMFKKVKLGPHEEIIKEALLASDPGDAEWYSVCVAKWSDFENGLGMMDPFRERYDNVNYYRLYIEGYVVYIKVDKSKSAKSISKIQLQPNAPLMILARELMGSKELPLMLDMARRHER